MAISKIQKGDKVKIISGKYKGLVGNILSVRIKREANKIVSKRVSVSTVPKINKFRRAYSFQGQSFPGSILSVDRYIDVSNVALLVDDSNVSKVKISLENGKKVRVYKKNGKPVVKPAQEENSIVEKKSKK